MWASQRGELVHPLERGEVKDIDSGRFARYFGANVAAYYDHLAVPDVACMTGSWIWSALAVLINLDPSERRHGQNPHIVVLGLVAIWDEVLTAEHVNVVRRPVR